jgi:hypothetical protein
MDEPTLSALKVRIADLEGQVRMYQDLLDRAVETHDKQAQEIAHQKAENNTWRESAVRADKAVGEELYPLIKELSDALQGELRNDWSRDVHSETIQRARHILEHQNDLII